MYNKKLKNEFIPKYRLSAMLRPMEHPWKPGVPPLMHLILNSFVQAAARKLGK
jgi:hypothetical protein